MRYLKFKRLCDIFFSLLIIILSFPILLIIAIAIYLTSPGPIIYKGKRSGLNEKIFEIYKFRTMIINAEKLGGFSTAKDDIRLIKIGRFLRKFKLDELPQLFNVLNGEMSFVGPRPQVTYYTSKYDEKLKKILTVRPGITDLATLEFADMDKILGSRDVDKYYEKEIEPKKNILRLNYIYQISFFLDLKILLLTFLTLIKIKK